MKFSTTLILVGTVGFFVWDDSALATHEIDHRYDIMGYVLDENQVPLANTEVSILLNNKVFGFGETDADGFYSIRLHLHDPDRGKKLQIKTAAGVADIRVTLTPGDNTTKRIHYANFSGGQFLETKLPRRGFPVWGYGIIIVAVGTAAIMAERYVRRRKRRLLNREKKKRKSKRRR